MRLTAWEEERLLIFSAAELARRHRAAGIALNQPEADRAHVRRHARDGAGRRDYAEVEAAGRAAMRRVGGHRRGPQLIDEVRVEVLLEDGTRLVVLVDPLGPVDPLGTSATEPGASGRSDRPDDRA